MWNGPFRVGRLWAWLLIAYAFALGIDLGGAIFDAIVIVPMWANSVASARHWNENPLVVIQGGRFLLAVSGVTALLALAALLASWRAPSPSRWRVCIGSAVFLVLLVCVRLYFIPEQWAIKGPGTRGLADAEVASRAHLWARLNWVRIAAEAAAYAIILQALRMAPKHSSP